MKFIALCVGWIWITEQFTVPFRSFFYKFWGSFRHEAFFWDLSFKILLAWNSTKLFLVFFRCPKNDQRHALRSPGWHKAFVVRQGWVTGNQGCLSTRAGMHPRGLLSYPLAQPGDRINYSWDLSKLSMGPVRTHCITVQRSYNLCISSKIKHNQPLEVKSDELYTLEGILSTNIFKASWIRYFLKPYVL